MLGMTDQELNRQVAEKVDGWEFHGSRDAYVGSDVMQAVPEYSTDPDGERHYEDWPFPDYCNDANAVLPLLEKYEYIDISRDVEFLGGWTVAISVKREGGLYHAASPTFPKAAVVALLKAHGVEVEG